MRQMIDVRIPMRDGVRLSTDIRMPAEGSFPVILDRTPYNNYEISDYQHSLLDGGYAIVRQDCRGRFDSEGTFRPGLEDEDGYDTIDWISKQPWCNGAIGMIGGSYGGLTQYTAAWNRPPGLKTITPQVMGSDRFRGMTYRYGVFELALSASWGTSVGGMRTGQSHATTDWNRVFNHLPLISLDEAVGMPSPVVREWLSHPVYDDFWRARSNTAHFSGFNIPVFHLGGWFDVFCQGTLENFTGIRKHGSPIAQAHQRIIMGPWAHAINTEECGQIHFGTNAAIDIDGLRTRWLDRWVRDIENRMEQEAPVRIYVMGENRWRDEHEWPLARTQYTDFFPATSNRANSLYGDGALLKKNESGRGTDTYAYDPSHPVPTLGGGTLHPELLSGPADHRPVERRDDVLVYTGPRLADPLEVTGEVRMILYASSDAPDTDFVARLCDVYPDGRSMLVCDGVTRARFHQGLDRECMLEPGKVYEFTIDMGATSQVFLAGHCLRLEITSSCFPRWNRNLNTDEPLATGTRMRIAHQTIYHCPAYPSRLVLPVIPG